MPFLSTAITAALVAGGVGAAGTIAAATIGSRGAKGAAKSQEQAARRAAADYERLAREAWDYERGITPSAIVAEGMGVGSAIQRQNELREAAIRRQSEYREAAEGLQGAGVWEAQANLDRYRGYAEDTARGGLAQSIEHLNFNRGQAQATALAGMDESNRRYQTLVDQGLGKEQAAAQVGIDMEQAASTDAVIKEARATDMAVAEEARSTARAQAMEAAGTEASLGMQRGVLGLEEAAYSPYTQAGIRSIDRMQDFGEHFETDPGYQFRRSEGEKAIERSAAARGGLLSGRAAKEMARFNQNLASEEYARAYGREADMASRGQRGVEARSATRGQFAGQAGADLIASGRFGAGTEIESGRFGAGADISSGRFGAGVGIESGRYGAERAYGSGRYGADAYGRMGEFQGQTGFASTMDAVDQWRRSGEINAANEMAIANMIAQGQYGSGQTAAGNLMGYYTDAAGRTYNAGQWQGGLMADASIRQGGLIADSARWQAAQAMNSARYGGDVLLGIGGRNYDATIDAGNARAAGQVGSANAWSGAVGDLSNYGLDYWANSQNRNRNQPRPDYLNPGAGWQGPVPGSQPDSIWGGAPPPSIPPMPVTPEALAQTVSRSQDVPETLAADLTPTPPDYGYQSPEGMRDLRYGSDGLLNIQGAQSNVHAAIDPNKDFETQIRNFNPEAQEALRRNYGQQVTDPMGQLDADIAAWSARPENAGLSPEELQNKAYYETDFTQRGEAMGGRGLRSDMITALSGYNPTASGEGYGARQSTFGTGDYTPAPYEANPVARTPQTHDSFGRRIGSVPIGSQPPATVPTTDPTGQNRESWIDSNGMTRYGPKPEDPNIGTTAQGRSSGTTTSAKGQLTGMTGILSDPNQLPQPDISGGITGAGIESGRFGGNPWATRPARPINPGGRGGTPWDRPMPDARGPGTPWDRPMPGPGTPIPTQPMPETGTPIRGRNPWATRPLPAGTPIAPARPGPGMIDPNTGLRYDAIPPDEGRSTIMPIPSPPPQPAPGGHWGGGPGGFPIRTPTQPPLPMQRQPLPGGSPGADIGRGGHWGGGPGGFPIQAPPNPWATRPANPGSARPQPVSPNRPYGRAPQPIRTTNPWATR
jgi:hypothetical protein